MSYVKGYGQEEPNGNTVFQIGSITKVFTTLLLQILCDEKVVHMEQTLDDLIGSKVSLSPIAKKITLKQLATHTSGLPRVPKVLEDKVIEMVGEETVMINPYSHIDVDSIFGYLSTTEDNHKAGQFMYSNYGMGLLAHVLESVTGKPYELLLLEKIFTPLNMNDTRITLTPKMKKLLVQGYTSEGNSNPIWTFSSLGGAGALNSNISDMQKFIEANFIVGTPVSNALKKMNQQQSNDASNIGWMKPGYIERFFGNKNIVWHNGMVGGYSSYLSIDKNTQSGVIVLTNKAVDVTMLGIMLTRQVRTQSWSLKNSSNTDEPLTVNRKKNTAKKK